MRFKKLVSDIELPEKTSPQRYTNVRANRRIDVCSGDTVKVSTGIHVTVSKNETAKLLGIASGVVAANVTTGELFIDVYNEYKRNIMIYPGMVLAEIMVETAPVKAVVRKPRVKKTRVSKPRVSKPRKTKLTSSAKLVEDASI